MSKCRLQFELKDSAEVVVNKMRKAISSASGEMQGDETGGTISVNTPLGSIAGSYSITGNELLVIIANKPMFIGCEKIKSILSDFLNRN